MNLTQLFTRKIKKKFLEQEVKKICQLKLTILVIQPYFGLCVMCVCKRDFIIEKQIKRYFVHYSKYLLQPSSLL